MLDTKLRLFVLKNIIQFFFIVVLFTDFMLKKKELDVLDAKFEVQDAIFGTQES